jgi:hypothetical protein
MRTLGSYVLALALAMALAALVFIALASHPGWSAATCQIAGAFCERSFFVPVLVTFAWGFMLKLDEYGRLG